jgi:DNA-binding SARP family transcriptional activator
MPERIEVRVLGAVELDRDGSPLTLRSTKLRGLLALLLLRRGSVVLADTLIEALWGADLPRTSRNALQVHVSTLRKLLAGDPRIRLEHRGAGYVLDCEDDQADLFRFRRLAEEAAAAAGGGDTERARELIGRALGLWRGQPFEGLDVPGLPTAEIASILEERAAALALRYELDLALGRHAEVVREIGALRAERPHDERLAALAALALYRSGRQADALAVLAELRRGLSEELGIEPGPAIGRLERQILAHDPALEPPSAEPDAEPREVRRVVTALICRLDRGDAATRSDPEAARGHLGRAIELARGILTAHGGQVGEVIGGRVTAIFGLEEAHEDDPVRAVRAAAELTARIGEARPSGSPLGARIGVATGEVLVRVTGRERSLLSADPLDLADRLAAAARTGEVMVSPATWTLAGGAAAMEPAKIIHLPDDAPPVSAYRLIEAPAIGRPRPGRTSPFVGRRHDLALLSGIAERTARERTASLVTVLGPAGIGKSRLVDELVRRFRGRARSRGRSGVLVGHCPPYGRDITFWPVAEMVRTAADVPLGMPGERVERRIARLLRAAGEADAGFVTGQLLGLLGLADLSTSPEDIAWALRRFLIAVARGRPIVVVFEDLHWAEDTLLDVIEHLAATTTVALLVVATARPELLERRTTWGAGRPNATNLTLGPLDDEACAQLLDNLLGGAPLEPALRSRIMDIAEGHPLFLEELLAMLIADGRLRWDDGRWVAVEGAQELAIPLTIRSLIEARLDRLPPAERATLEVAAVMGRVFSETDLVALGGDDAAPARLDALARRDLIVPERVSREGRTFRFRHTLIREVAYRGIPKRTRAAVHAAIGTHLERQAGARTGEVEEVLAYHLASAVRYGQELSEEPDPSLVSRAIEHLAAAGRRAFCRGDMPAAAGLLDRALALMGERDPRAPELSWRRAVALVEMGRFAEAACELDRGEAAAQRLGDAGWGWRLRMERADLGFWREPTEHDSRHLAAVAEEALRELEAIGDRSGMARACRLMGDALACRGRYEEAMSWFEDARRHAEAAGDERELREQATAGIHGPVPVGTCVDLLRASVARERRPNPDTLAALGLMLAMAGDAEGADAAFEESLAHAAELGAGWKTANVLMHQGAALLIRGDPEGARSVLGEAVGSLRGMGERGMLSTAVALLGEALYRLGRDDEAMAATLESEGATAPDDVASQVAWRSVRAKLLARRGEPSEALRLAREAVELADGTDALQMAGDAHADLAEVLLGAGSVGAAAHELGRAIDLYERKGNLTSARRARARLAQLQGARA